MPSIHISRGLVHIIGNSIATLAQSSPSDTAENGANAASLIDLILVVGTVCFLAWLTKKIRSSNQKRNDANTARRPDM